MSRKKGWKADSSYKGFTTEKDKIKRISSFFPFPIIMYIDILVYIDTITTNKLENYRVSTLDDKDHLIKNLKIMWQNKNRDLHFQPRQVIDFVYFIIFNKDKIFDGG